MATRTGHEAARHRCLGCARYLLAEAGRECVERVVAERDEIIVPWLFWSEVINTLARRHRWPGSQVLAAVYDLEQIGLSSEAPSRMTVLGVIDAVERYGLTAYDAEYLVLAEVADADLLTGDARLAAAVPDRVIRVGLDHRLGEPTGRYEAQSPDWPRWSGTARYLKELRREAQADLIDGGWSAQ